MAFPLQSAPGQAASGILAVLVVLPPGAALAAKPSATPAPHTVPPPVVVISIEPWAAMPGAAVGWTLTGKDVAEAQAIWSSPEVSIEPASAPKASSAHATFMVTAPASTPLGVAAFRLATARGVSNPTLFLIDSLPSVKGADDHRTLEKAQRITPPVAVDGQCEAEAIDYYRFHGQARQELSIEVVAQRLGSPLDAGAQARRAEWLDSGGMRRRGRSGIGPSTGSDAAGGRRLHARSARCPLRRQPAASLPPPRRRSAASRRSVGVHAPGRDGDGTE